MGGGDVRVTELSYSTHIITLIGVRGYGQLLQTDARLPSNRRRRSNGDCLEGKSENYQVCSVQYCVQQLCTVQCTHIRTDLIGLWIAFCFTGPISLCLD